MEPVSERKKHILAHHDDSLLEHHTAQLLATIPLIIWHIIQTIIKAHSRHEKSSNLSTNQILLICNVHTFCCI